MDELAKLQQMIDLDPEGYEAAGEDPYTEDGAVIPISELREDSPWL